MSGRMVDFGVLISLRNIDMHQGLLHNRVKQITGSECSWLLLLPEGTPNYPIVQNELPQPCPFFGGVFVPQPE